MKSKRVRVRQLYRERKEKEEYHSLIKEVRVFDKMLFYQQFRMTEHKYETLFVWELFPTPVTTPKFLPVSFAISSGLFCNEAK